MGILDTLRETIGLLQKVDNIDLYKQMIELQQQVHALVDENRNLKDSLSRREDLEFRKNTYWSKSTGAGPYCSRCLDADGKLTRMHTRAGIAAPWCPACQSTAPDPDQPVPQPTIEPRSSSWG